MSIAPRGFWKKSFIFLSLVVVLQSTITLAPAALANEQPSITRFANVPDPGNPEGMAAGDDGNLYVGSFDLSQSRQNIYTFNPSGQLITTTLFPGGAPLGMVASGDKLFVVDVFFGTVLEFQLPLTATSTPINRYQVCGGFFAAELPNGPLSNDFCALNALRLGPDGRFYVADNGAVAPNLGKNVTRGRILWLDTASQTSGVFLDDRRLDVAGFPGFGVAGLEFDAHREGDGCLDNRACPVRLFVSNFSTSAILTVTASGSPLKVTGELTDISPSTPIAGPNHLAFDDKGTLWVTSGQKDQVVGLQVEGQKRAVVKDVVGSFQGFTQDGAPVGFLQPSTLVFGKGTMYVDNEANQSLHDKPGSPSTVDWSALRQSTVVSFKPPR